MNSTSPHADADAVADAIRALHLPATGPHLVTLSHGPTSSSIGARHEPVDPDVWHAGIHTVLRAFAIGLRGHAGTDPTVYGYALVLSDEQTACVVTRDGARHVIALAASAHADSAAKAAAMDGLQAMVDAVCDRG